MTLIPELRDKRARHEWFTLRPFAVIAASVAVVWSTSLVARGWGDHHEQPREPPRTIAAVGAAERYVQPDHMRWQATLTVQGTDCAAATQELLTTLDRVRAYLLAHDVRADELDDYPTDCAVTKTADTSSDATGGLNGTDPTPELRNGVYATHTLSLYSRDVARAVRGYRALTVAPDFDAVALEQPTCLDHLASTIEDELVAAARIQVRVRAVAAVAAVGDARLGKLVTSDFGTVYVDTESTPALEACVRGGLARAIVNATYEID